MLALTILSASYALMTPQTMGITPDAAFPIDGEPLVLNYGDLRPGQPFDEAIVSWNVKSPSAAQVTIEARGRAGADPTKWYRMAEWSIARNGRRQSTDGQKDADGDVLTDTLRFTKPQNGLDLRVTLRRLDQSSDPVLDLVTVSFSRGKAAVNDQATPSPAWGRMLTIPERAQGNYPRGNVLCSPTSVSMLMKHYSTILKQPDLDRDVPEVEAAVYDPVYKGAGNWPFNTAFVGSFPGMRAYVSRFGSIRDLERWIEAGLPVICSVSFDLVRGRPLSPSESGHLVVLIGFEKDGDPIFNDPARKDQVRYVYKRADFERGWVYSHRTVYLIHPINAKVPTGSHGRWLEMSQ